MTGGGNLDLSGGGGNVEEAVEEIVVDPEEETKEVVTGVVVDPEEETKEVVTGVVVDPEEETKEEPEIFTGGKVKPPEIVERPPPKIFDDPPPPPEELFTEDPPGSGGGSGGGSGSSNPFVKGVTYVLPTPQEIMQSRAVNFMEPLDAIINKGAQSSGMFSEMIG